METKETDICWDWNFAADRETGRGSWRTASSSLLSWVKAVCNHSWGEVPGKTKTLWEHHGIYSQRQCTVRKKLALNLIYEIISCTQYTVQTAENRRHFMKHNVYLLHIHIILVQAPWLDYYARRLKAGLPLADPVCCCFIYLYMISYQFHAKNM